MASQRVLNTAPRPRPLSADSAGLTAAASAYPTVPTKESMLYSMLPSAVQNRLPRIPSLRRSVSMYGGATRKYRRMTGPRPDTPPDDYQSAMVVRPIVADGKGGEMTDYFEQTSEEEEDSARFVSGRPARPSGDIVEGKSGIGWKFAGQGLSLLSLSVEESSTISRNESYGNAPFARQLYIHALTYLLRGLPSDMTTEEQLSVRSAIPSGIVSPLRVEVASQPTLTNSASTRSDPSPPSIIHRAFASSIIQLIILFSFILPYIRFVLQRIYDYERRNRFTERLLAGSLDTIDGLGRKGWGVSAAIWGAGLGDVLGWVLEEVGAGVREGVGEGMVRLRKDGEPEDGSGRRAWR